MQAIETYIKAGAPGIFVVSHEEARSEAAIAAIARKLEYGLFIWSVTDGLQAIGPNGGTTQIPETEDPSAMLAQFMRPAQSGGANTVHDKCVVIARDMHAFLGGPRDSASPMLVRKLRDALTFGKQCQRVIVSLGCQLNVPPEVEKEMVVVEFKLPTRSELNDVLEGIAKSADITVKAEEVDALLTAASGMTTSEAENAFAVSYAESKALRPDIVHREKAAVVKKNGLLEIVESKTRLDDIGGLVNLKRDLHEKRNLFTREAKDYGLPTPRGLLVVGQPGTGKSLTASATSSTFGLPLLRLEAGRLFGSLVGESEGNWRRAFATVKAVQPCILWIDEVDGLFAGSGSGSTDGGTTQRVLKAILQDMQMNGDGVFFMFTANDVDKLPDPLIDRLDVWSVDLPTQSEREDIWRIHIAKRNRKPKAFDLPELARLTDGFSGRQIEQVWFKALTLAFNDGGREPKMKDCQDAIGRVTPTSKTMAAQIEARRKRLEGKATPASGPEESTAKKTGGTRKLA